MTKMSPGHRRFATSDDEDALAQFNDLVSGTGGTDHYVRLHELRSAGAVHRGMPELGITAELEGVPPSFTAYSFDAVSEVLADHETFSSAAYGDLIGAVMGRSLLEMDEPEHRAYRQVLQKAFSRAEMRQWEQDSVRPMIEQTIDGFASRPERRAELVRELCLPFPVAAIAAILGLPPEDHRLFQRLAIELIGVSIDWDRAVAASGQLREYFAAVLEQRRAQPHRDMISVLAHAEAEGQRLSDDDIFAFLRLLLPAGAETTYRVSSSLLCGLLSDREQLELVRADRSLLVNAVEEAVRWESPLQFVPRVTTRAVELAGWEIPAGANVNCHLGAANHDPDRFDDPERFDLRRPRRGSVGFGYGVHTCLGMHLSKMEAVAVVDTLLDRLPSIRIDESRSAPFVGGTIMRSVPELHVTW